MMKFLDTLRLFRPEDLSGSPEGGETQTEVSTDADLSGEAQFDLLGDGFLGLDLPADVGRKGDKDPAADDGAPPAEAPLEEGGSDGSRQAADPKPPSTPKSPAPEPKEGQDPRDELIAEMRRQLQELRGQSQPKPEATPKAEEDPDQSYARQAFWEKPLIPPQVLQAMDSDDPAERAQAIQGIVAATVTKAVLEARKFTRETLAEFQQRVPEIATQTVDTRTEAQRIQTDFYGSYPMLNTPAFAPIVRQSMLAAAQEFAANGHQVTWGEDLKEAAADKIRAALGPLGSSIVRADGAKPQATPQPKPQASAPRAPARAPFMSGSGGRPAAIDPMLDEFDTGHLSGR